jgi:hypothetical protein
VSSGKCLQLTCKLDTHNMAVRDGGARASQCSLARMQFWTELSSENLESRPETGPLQRALPAGKELVATARAHPKCFREGLQDRSEIVRPTITNRAPK